VIGNLAHFNERDAAMSVAEDAKAALDQFETENPALKGKAYLTSGNRTVDEQLDIILDPKRKDNYLNIKERFKKKYKLKELPKRAELSDDQVKWWRDEIQLQAGKSPGFPHVGGFAQDVSVKNLDKDGKDKLKKAIEAKKLSILMEKVTGTESKYGVSLEQANVFHVTK
jgi:hypothetical protein